MIIGGLVSSTMLARIVTPVMYRMIVPRVEMAGDERRGVPPDLAVESAM